MMNENLKKLPPGVFVIIILCFFLPFASLSCQGQTVAKVSALKLVTGTTIEGIPVSSEPLAIFVLLLAVIGLFLGFLKFKNSELFGSLTGAVGFILTIVLKSGIENDVARGSSGAFEVNSEIGYMLILLLFLVAMGVNGYNWKHKQLMKEGKVIYCSTCGTQNSATNHNCPHCGCDLSGRL